MKRAWAFLPLCFAVAACSKHPVHYQNKGVIRGWNPCDYPCVINCPCACGSYFFHFTDGPDTANIVIDNPDFFHFPATVHFPVPIEVNWLNTTRCHVRAIRITAYKMD